MSITKKIMTAGAALVLAGAVAVPAQAAPTGTAAAAALPSCVATTPKTLTNGATAWVPAASVRGSSNCVFWSTSTAYNPAAFRLQEALVYGEGQQIAIDGYYGQGTRAAVIRVQQRYGLGVDGQYGPATGRAMTWRASNGSLAKWK